MNLRVLRRRCVIQLGNCVKGSGKSKKQPQAEYEEVVRELGGSITAHGINLERREVINWWASSSTTLKARDSF